MSRGDQCAERMLTLDLYREPFRVLLPDNEGKYRTLLGAIFSLATMFVLLTYAGFKFNTLVNF